MLVVFFPALWFFYLSVSTVLSGDASPTRLGSLLLQNCQPVTFSSKSLTQTQQRYCQIELLAVQLGLLRFKQAFASKSQWIMITNRLWVCWTNQWPSAPRIQRFAYNFKVLIFISFIE
jgi:hypothetical protein